MIVGTMHHSTIVHIARHCKTTPNGNKLYEPACTGMRRTSVAYLATQEGSLDTVTCKRCQQKAALYPSRYLSEGEVSCLHA